MTYINPVTRFGGVDQIVVPDRRVGASKTDDAPFDSGQYVRTDGEWVPFEAAVDTLAPAPPTNLSSSGVIAIQGDTVNYTLAWDAPVTNTDDTALTDFAYYVVHWRYTAGPGAGPWASFTSKEPEALLPGRTPAIDIEWEVLARDYSGNDSTWVTGTIIGLTDTGGPEKPSVPVLTSRLGTIMAMWDGLDYAGAAPPLDFDRLEVFVSATSGGPWVFAGSVSGAGGVIITAVAVGDVRYVTTVAVDTTGNTSVRSAENSITVIGVTGPDIMAGAVTTNNLYAGAVTAEKIAAYAITAAQIAADAITAVKIKAGAVTADKIVAGAITADKIQAGAVTAGKIEAYSVTADKLSADAITSKTITGGTINGTTITGVTVSGSTFSTQGDTSRVDMGQVGYPTDQIRMWNAYQVSSIRNPDDNPGAIRFGLGSGASFDMVTTADGHRGLKMGYVMLKGLSASYQMQVRNVWDSDYASIMASAFTVAASLTSLKKSIKPVVVDTAVELVKNGVNEWEWKNPEAETGKQYGLLADDMPEWMREGEGYQMTGVIAFLWEALKQTNARVAALEAKVK